MSCRTLPPSPPTEHRRADRPARGTTTEQRRTIHTLACLTLLLGRPPVLGELAAALRITKQSAADRLHWLEKKGLWSRDGHAVTTEGLRSALG